MTTVTVTCIMPTADRPAFLPKAIAGFQAQDYPERELLVLDDGEESVERLVPRDDPRIRYRREAPGLSLGAKRNLACEDARGEIIAHWDDDDWYAPWRLSCQVRKIIRGGADICGLDRVMFVDFRSPGAWEYVYPAGGRPWVHGATLCYRREIWRRNPFPPVKVGEDTRFVWNAAGARIRALPDNRFYVGTIHDSNTGRKCVTDPRWHRIPLGEVRRAMGRDWPASAQTPGPLLECRHG